MRARRTMICWPSHRPWQTACSFACGRPGRIPRIGMGRFAIGAPWQLFSSYLTPCSGEGMAFAGTSLLFAWCGSSQGSVSSRAQTVSSPSGHRKASHVIARNEDMLNAEHVAETLHFLGIAILHVKSKFRPHAASLSSREAASDLAELSPPSISQAIVLVTLPVTFFSCSPPSHSTVTVMPRSSPFSFAYCSVPSSTVPFANACFCATSLSSSSTA